MYIHIISPKIRLIIPKEIKLMGIPKILIKADIITRKHMINIIEIPVNSV